MSGDCMENNEFNDVELFVDSLILDMDTYKTPTTVYGYIDCIQSILGALLNEYNLDAASIDLDCMTDDIYELVIDSEFMVYVSPVEKNQDEYNEQYDYGFLYIDSELPVHFVNYIDQCGYDYQLFSIEDLGESDSQIEPHEHDEEGDLVLATFDTGIPGICLMYDSLSENTWKFVVDKTGDE